MASKRQRRGLESGGRIQGKNTAEGGGASRQEGLLRIPISKTQHPPTRLEQGTPTAEISQPLINTQSHLDTPAKELLGQGTPVDTGPYLPASDLGLHERWDPEFDTQTALSTDPQKPWE